MKNLETILGGNSEIMNNEKALKQRVINCPLINKETQPTIYKLVERLSELEGCSVEEYQIKMDRLS